MKTFTDYYEVLEVRENASDEVIKMAYKALALKYHPDKNGDTRINAHNKMQIINEAYMILSNQEKRKQYDQQMKIMKSIKSQNNDHDDLHKKRERERMYEEAKVRSEKENYEEEIRRQEEVKRKAEEYKNGYSNEKHGAHSQNGFSYSNEEGRNNTHKGGSGFIVVFIVIIIIVIFASSFSNTGGTNVELNPAEGTPIEKAERASRAVRIVKDSFSSSDGPEVWVKNGNVAKIYGWSAFNFNNSTFFVSYEFDNDTNKENGYSQYAYEVDINSGIVKPIGGDSLLEKKYRELGYID